MLLLPPPLCSVAVQPLSASRQCLRAAPSHLLLQCGCRQADIRQPPELLAIDCEMCEVAGNKRELLGLSVINAARQTVLKVGSITPLPHSWVSSENDQWCILRQARVLSDSEHWALSCLTHINGQKVWQASTVSCPPYCRCWCSRWLLCWTTGPQ